MVPCCPQHHHFHGLQSHRDYTISKSHMLPMLQPCSSTLVSRYPAALDFYLCPLFSKELGLLNTLWDCTISNWHVAHAPTLGWPISFATTCIYDQGSEGRAFQNTLELHSPSFSRTETDYTLLSADTLRLCQLQYIAPATHMLWHLHNSYVHVSVQQLEFYNTCSFLPSFCWEAEAIIVSIVSLWFASLCFHCINMIYALCFASLCFHWITFHWITFHWICFHWITFHWITFQWITMISMIRIRFTLWFDS
jgi:hypothetical protein